MWNIYDNKDLNIWEAHYFTEESLFPIVIIKMLEHSNYKIMIKSKSTRMPIGNIFESNSEVAKLKSILIAKDMGWKIKSVV